MLFPERMVRVEIAIDGEHLYEALESIGRTGLLHIDRRGERPFFHELQERVEKLLAVVEGYLDFLGVPTGGGESGGRIADYSRFLTEAEKRLSTLAPTIETLKEKMKRIEGESNMIERAADFSKALEGEVDIGKIVEHLDFIGFKAVVLAQENVETFLLALKRYDPFVVYAPLSGGSVSAALFYDRSDESHMLNAISKLEGSEIPDRYFSQKRVEELRAQKREIEAAYERFGKRYGAELANLHAGLKRVLEIFALHSALQKRNGRYFLYGWVPKRQAGRFEAALQYAEAIFSKAGDDAPVLLKTPKILKPFETLVQSFSYPGYNEINPTIPFAFAFIIMFGAMFGDIGHGIVLALIGGIVSKSFPKYADLGKVYILAGAGSALFGLFYGSFFGFHDVVPHLLFVPVENVDLSIYTGIAIGIFFITVGFLLNIFSLARRKRVSALFLGEGGVLWLLIYWFAIGIVVKALIFELPVRYELYLLGGLVAVLFLILLIRKGAFAQTLLDTLIRMFEQAVNTISFARLGAFALAHGALFLALFSVADILSKADSRGVGYWFIIILGNCFIIVLEGVVVTIQTLRLEYYEFFKRFFKGGGEPYKPFVLESER